MSTPSSVFTAAPSHDLSRPGDTGISEQIENEFSYTIQQCIAQAHSDHLAELESLLTLKFQTFTEVLVLGEEAKVDSSAGEKQKQAQVSLFPKRKQAQKKVSSKAA